MKLRLHRLTEFQRIVAGCEKERRLLWEEDLDRVVGTDNAGNSGVDTLAWSREVSAERRVRWVRCNATVVVTFYPAARERRQVTVYIAPFGKLSIRG